mmetsp:Transcript_82870/g.173515  ORF Transcript_82870/g.173515 Transcript_82870/m.173515 type:complete len:506 (+) Transcript_82870:158-1675(+)
MGWEASEEYVVGPMKDCDEDDWKDRRSRSQAIVECVVLNLTQVAWAADNALLPAVFNEFSKEFEVDTTALSILVMLRGISESIFSFPSGFLADMLPRPKLICLGSIIWAIGLFGCAVAPTFTFVCVARVVNGIGLGIVQPLLCSLIADTNAPDRRGRAFGMLSFTGNMGATFGGLFATSLAPLIIWGIPGWRFVLIIVGIFSCAVGIAVLLMVGEPRAKFQVNQKSFFKVLKDNMPKVCHLFSIKSFIIVLLQGAPGNIPWFAFSFLTMYLELNCFSHSDAARIVMFMGFGTAACGILGGKMLDSVAKRFPSHGAPALAQFSSGIGVPMLGLIFFIMPTGEDADSGIVLLYCGVFFVFGVLVACCGIINAKIFADIVPQTIFTYVYAVDRTVEGTLGAAGSPAVGLLTDKVFQYNATAARVGACSPKDAHSLGQGIFSISFAAWSICFTCYSLMHCTYPADRKRLMDQAVVPGKGTQPVVSCADPVDSDSDSSDSTWESEFSAVE